VRKVPLSNSCVTGTSQLRIRGGMAVIRLGKTWKETRSI
jgi:hypothetical protein